MSQETKSKYEEFTLFFEKPTRDSLRNLLQRNYGETNQLDFKKEMIEFVTLARHILAIANTGGGCIIFGVTEKEDKSLEPIGLSEITDKTKISNGVDKYLPDKVKYETLDFSYTESEYKVIVGKKFQIVLVFDTPEYLPFVSKADGKDIKKSAIYIRRGAASEQANYEEIQALLNRRIETGYSTQSEFDLQKEFQELKFLFEQIDRFIVSKEAMPALSFLGVPNPNFPKETLEDFVKRMIELKKKKIENRLMERII